MSLRSLVTCAALSVATGVGVRWTRVLEIEQGRLTGVATSTHNKYLGIPYARVHKRFQVASPSPKWTNIFRAIEDRHCTQNIPFLNIPYGIEDCLIINVYTPANATSDSPVPVMFYIHGGGFQLGFSSSLVFGPDRLVERGVVVVTFTYRLGALGFLCLDLEGASGNVGMKDMVMALKWVRDNINAFGGDPSAVTIFGESAGASAVHLLMLSEMSRGLFHRAILESNTALNSIIFAYDPIGKASEVAKKLGYNTREPKELLSIFQRANLSDLIVATDSPELTRKFRFVPCAEKKFNDSEPFLVESPYEILRSGNFTKVPMIIGHNEKEGALFVGLISKKEYERYDQHFEERLPADINFRTTKDKVETANVVRHFYAGKTFRVRKDVKKLTNFITDVFFHFPNVISSEIHLKSSNQPVYNYYYTYDSDRNIGRIFSNLSHKSGATHFDESLFLFNPSLRTAELTGKDFIMAHRLAILWTNFAKTGNPTPSPTELIPNVWTPSDRSGLNFYKLDNNMDMIGLPNIERIDLWRNIYNRFGYKKAHKFD